MESVRWARIWLVAAAVLGFGNPGCSPGAVDVSPMLEDASPAAVADPADVPVEVVLGEDAGITGSKSSVDKAGIVELVKGLFDLSPYHRVSVQVKQGDGPEGSSDHLLVSLLPRDRYDLTLARVDLEAGQSKGGARGGYAARKVTMPYEPDAADAADLAVEKGDYAACPDPTVQMVFSCCETGLPTAIAAVKAAGEWATQKGYKAKVLLGREENREAIKSWYACPNLLMHGRVGHGNTSGIQLGDGFFSYTYFQALSGDANRNKVFYYNSCLVHNRPLEPAIMKSGARTFLGGNVSIYVGPSEKVFKCWLQKTLANEVMTESLPKCEKETRYPSWGDAHGATQDPNQPNRLAPDGGIPTIPPQDVDAPVAKFTSTVKDLSVTFADKSTSPTATPITRWEWSFGDAKLSNEQNPTHVYAASGNYTVQLKVTDQAGRVGSATQPVQVSLPPDPAGVPAIQSDTPVNGLSGAQDSWKYYRLDVPQGATKVAVQLLGIFGDADLYVRAGAKPTTTEYTCKSHFFLSIEACVINSPTAGPYYVGVHGYRSFQSVLLYASVSKSYAKGSPSLAPGQSLTYLSGARSEWQFIALEVPAGTARLEIRLSGGAGDADLYVRREAEPTATEYLCRPYQTGNDETCLLDAPAPGRYFLGLDAYENFAGAILDVRAAP